MNEDRNIRAALDRHWEEHEIYHDDAVLEHPAVGGAHPRSAQYSSVSFSAAEQEALYGVTRIGSCRPLGH
jgi:hypothetical protein